MKQTKFKLTILALALVLLLSVATLFAINFKPVQAGGTVTVDGSNVFTASGEANVVVDKQGDGTDAEYFKMFTFGYGEDSVSYRRNLAYHWFEEITEGEGDNQTKYVAPGFFNMEIGFKNVDFDKFIITFESQQFAKTEENKTVNYIVFFPTDDGGVRAAVTDDKDVSEADSVTLSPNHIYIRFYEKLEGGVYSVIISDAEGAMAGDTRVITGEMKNVGGNYAKYSSSSTTPVYPIIFSAEPKEDKVAEMVMYSLNNQKFAVENATKRDDSDYYTGGSVRDNTPAVLCLNTEISHLNVGGEVKFDYQIIDVLRTSPSSELFYRELKYDEIGKEDTDYTDTGKYVKVESDFRLDSDKETYLPSVAECSGFGDNDSFKVDMAIKAYAKVTDTTNNGEESIIYLDWYLSDAHKLKIDGSDFIAVGEDVRGVTYNRDWSVENDPVWQQACDDYQTAVTEAAKNLSAGSSSYFYLPSAEKLFKDNATAYADMKISIYYYGDSQSSNTTLNPNNLSINVTKPGSYRFTLYATDAASNDMYYMDGGKVVEFKTGEIWDIYADDDKHDILPWFSFSVDYMGAQFKEKPDKQSTAYVGTNYSSAGFEVNGVDNSYEIKYRLFVFDRAGYYAANDKKTFTYDEFIENMDELFEDSETRKFFREIHEVTETDENYEEFKDYGWSSTSTSFTPQDGNAFYYIRAEVTDTQYNTDPVTCSLAVVASVEAKALKGDSDWLQNNVASVILLSVAGVSLIAIILLLVIKPKNKEDIDVQFEKEVNKKKNK